MQLLAFDGLGMPVVMPVPSILGFIPDHQVLAALFLLRLQEGIRVIDGVKPMFLAADEDVNFG